MCRCHLHLDLLSVEKKYDLGPYNGAPLEQVVNSKVVGCCKPGWMWIQQSHSCPPKQCTQALKLCMWVQCTSMSMYAKHEVVYAPLYAPLYGFIILIKTLLFGM